MKKLLLSLAALMVMTTSFAYEVGDYLYTSAAKYKVIGDNLAASLSSWSGATDVDTWSVYTGEDATDNSLQSLAGDENATTLFTNLNLTFGSTYVVTFKVKAPADATSSITEAAQNQIDAWVTSTASDGSKTGTAGTDYIQVASATTLVGGEWTTVSFSYTAIDELSEDQSLALNIKIGRLTTETVIADAEVREVTQVYDTRIMDAKVDFFEKLKNTGAFTGETDELDELIQGYYFPDMVGLNTEDEASMSEYEALIDEAATAWMDQNSSNLLSKFQYGDIFSLGRYNRGNISNGQVIGNLIFRGENWLHSWGKDESGSYSASLASYDVAKQIQGSYANNAGSVALYNTNIPTGKYYISCEVRNALVDKNYVATYTLEKNVKLFIGSDSTEVTPIKGEAYTKLFMVGELKEGETFEAGVWWEGHESGSNFSVKNFEIRSITAEGEESAEEKIARSEATKAFFDQYNAAVSAKNQIEALIADKANYPWEQDSLRSAIDTWTPYLDAVKPWIVNETTLVGKNVVSTDAINAWVLYQGDEEKADTYGSDIQEPATYQVVRGLQNALNYAKAQNKPYQDLIAKVKEAKDAVASGDYKGDASEVNTLVTEAEDLISTVSELNQFDDYTTELSALTLALQSYYDSSASYKTPSDLALVDPFFTKKTGNIAGGTTTYWNDATNQTGWVSYTTDSKAYFRVGDGGKDDNGEYLFTGTNRAAMWRGWTGNPSGQLYQDIKVSKAGHYQFVCQAYVTGDDIKINNGIRSINIQTETQTVYDEDLEEWVEDEVEISRDTVYHSGIYLEFDDLAKETVSLGSQAKANILANHLEVYTSPEVAAVYVPKWFTLNLDVATNEETTLRIALNGLNNAYNPDTDTFATYGPNAYGIGSCHVYYYGDSEQYYKDAEANGGDYNPCTTAIQSVAPAKKTIAGVYSLTGQKVGNSLNGLSKGIYIMNGKKYFVK